MDTCAVPSQAQGVSFREHARDAAGSRPSPLPLRPRPWPHVFAVLQEHGQGREVSSRWLVTRTHTGCQQSPFGLSRKSLVTHSPP